jgi:hypothetical protein
MPRFFALASSANFKKELDRLNIHPAIFIRGEYRLPDLSGRNPE